MNHLITAYTPIYSMVQQNYKWQAYLSLVNDIKK